MNGRFRAVPAWVWLVALVPLIAIGAAVASQLSTRDLSRYFSRSEPAPAPGPSASATPGFAPLTGEAAELSSIMGRARRMANEWQREAALIGIEAVLLRSKVQTLEGATAKLIFGPSPFVDKRQRGDLFVVTYDQTGLHGEAMAGTVGKALPEPMCAPEHVLRQVTDLGAVPVSLRYGFDSDERALWFTSPSQRPEQLRVFDPQDCSQRGNIVVVPRARR